jgi:glycosyltransferase involved in cell wall biosynthesis
LNNTIAFVWENFGPLHVDRCEAVMNRGFDVIGIEFTGRSSTYGWAPFPAKFRKVTLLGGEIDGGLSEAKLLRALLSMCYRSGAHHFFFCHYEKPAILLSALAMRGVGRHVYMMYESKFDDHPRNLWREFIKRQFLKPYHGCLAGSTRTQDYVRFLGMRPDRIVRGYDTVSVQRMKRQLSDVCSVAVPFDQRHFTIVARLVEKKNHSLALQAYRRYLSTSSNPRRLIICGSGLLENELKAEVKSLSLDQFVTFTGFIQTEEVSRILSSTLALILPSTQEQFGQVVLEAMAIGLPVLVSEACGARDELVRTGVNGFVFESDNPEGLAWFMSSLAHDQNLWIKMCHATKRFLPLCDVTGFADGVEQLVSISRGGVPQREPAKTA